MCIYIYIINLFYSSKKLIKACVGESPEGTAKCNSVWNHVKIVASIHCSNRHDLYSEVGIRTIRKLLEGPESRKGRKILYWKDNLVYTHLRVQWIGFTRYDALQAYHCSGGCQNWVNTAVWVLSTTLSATNFCSKEAAAC